MENLVVFLFITSIAGAMGYKNVLFIPVDDLRPQIFEGFGQKYMHTPNLNRLVKESMVFQRAYTQEALCVPSRNSFMTGRRPDTTQVWDSLGNAHFRITGPDWISLPQHFKEHGFTTLGGGKTYHPNKPPNWDEPKSWSQDKPYFPFAESKCPNDTDRLKGSVAAIATWCPLDESKYPDEYHYDWKLANETIHTLKYVNGINKPWFVAAGFRRPHDPWMMPQRYWDMYNSSDIPTVLHKTRPKNSPDLAFFNRGVYIFSNGTQYLPMPEPIPDEIQQDVRHAYMSSVSWVDSQIGRVLKAIDDMGIANDTLVVLFGDHGYQLGEHDSWHKMTNWELAVRVPLIIRAPWKPNSQGKSSYALVELVDLYKTISELVGAPEPGKDIEGTSFAKLFDYPDLDAYEFAKLVNETPAAYSQYLRCPKDGIAEWDNNSCSIGNTDERTYMGYSIRIPDWRYTAWMSWDREKRETMWDQHPYSFELYHHGGPQEEENDFNKCEIENVAGTDQDVVVLLHEQLKNFFSKH